MMLINAAVSQLVTLFDEQLCQQNPIFLRLQSDQRFFALLDVLSGFHFDEVELEHPARNRKLRWIEFSGEVEETFDDNATIDVLPHRFVSAMPNKIHSKALEKFRTVADEKIEDGGDSLEMFEAFWLAWSPVYQALVAEALVIDGWDARGCLILRGTHDDEDFTIPDHFVSGYRSPPVGLLIGAVIAEAIETDDDGAWDWYTRRRRHHTS